MIENMHSYFETFHCWSAVFIHNKIKTLTMYIPEVKCKSCTI